MTPWHLLGRALCWSPAAGLLRTVPSARRRPDFLLASEQSGGELAEGLRWRRTETRKPRTGAAPALLRVSTNRAMVTTARCTDVAGLT
jgi:hypothetical protein